MRTRTNAQTPGDYAGRVVTKPPAWHDLVVLDVLFNNLSTGLYLAAAICELALPAVFTPAATWAYPLALFLLSIDLVLLVLDLGNRLRFHHMLRVFKPSSPMSLGTWCLTAFSFFMAAIIGVAAAEGMDWLRGHEEPLWWARKLLVAMGLPVAFGSAAYKGVLFSTTAQPGWKDARWLGAYLIGSAVVLGTAELWLIAAILDRKGEAEVMLAPAIAWLAGVNLVLLGLLASDLHPELWRLYSRRARLVTAVGVVLFGVAVPIGLSAVSSGVAVASVVLASLVAANLGVRYVIIHLPHRATTR